MFYTSPHIETHPSNPVHHRTTSAFIVLLWNLLRHTAQWKSVIWVKITWFGNITKLSSSRTPGDELTNWKGKMRAKSIHPVGVVGKVRWKDLGGHRYSGIFKGAQHGLARWSILLPKIKKSSPVGFLLRWSQTQEEWRQRQAWASSSRETGCILQTWLQCSPSEDKSLGTSSRTTSRTIFQGENLGLELTG